MTNLLQDTDVFLIMRQAVKQAYPDQQYYMHISIKQIVPHSNCVIAAVALKQRNIKNDKIAYRLRWHINSEPTYLRECWQGLGAILLQSLQGVLQSQ